MKVTHFLVDKKKKVNCGNLGAGVASSAWRAAPPVPPLLTLTARSGAYLGLLIPGN